MGDMKRRFALYGFGFILGIGLVFFFLGGKNASCNWLPNDRMLNIIRSKQIQYSENIKDAIATKEIDSTDINYLLLDGDIDFSKSQTKNKPCRNYLIEGKKDKKEMSITVKICDSIATIQSINFGKKD